MIEKPLIRPYQPGDETPIVDLLRQAFNDWPRLDLQCTPLEHWTWKFLDTPYKKSFISVGEHKEQIIACEHELLLKTKLGKSSRLGTYSSDQAVHPGYRGMGLSKELVSYSTEQRRIYGCSFGYWITSNPVMIKSYQRNWPRFPHRVHNLVKIDDVGRQLIMMPMKRPRLMRLGYLLLKYLNLIKSHIKGQEQRDQTFTVSEVNMFDDRINQFWAKISDNYDFIVERTKEYLNWRYCDPRAGPHSILVAELDDEIVGYSVLRVNRFRPDYPVGYIVDVLALPGRLDVADALIGELVRHLRSQGVNLCNCFTIKGHPYEPIYKKHGFLDSRVTTHIFYNPIMNIEDTMQEIQYAAPDRIYFSYGDIDSLPVEAPEITFSITTFLRSS